MIQLLLSKLVSLRAKRSNLIVERLLRHFIPRNDTRLICQKHYGKAQALVVVLWVLITITVLTISVGHRVSLALRIARYQEQRLKALSLARAGISRVIIELTKDNNTYDALNESWSNNEEVFKKILVGDDSDEFAVVSYDDGEETRFGVVDEEGKININYASEGLLSALLEGSGINVETAKELASDILIWRGDKEDKGTEEYYQDNLGYACKSQAFTNVEEILLVKGVSNIEEESLDKLMGLITVHGEGKVNINTASLPILKAFVNYYAGKIGNSESQDADNLAEKIAQWRGEGNMFTDLSGLGAITGLNPWQQLIINELKQAQTELDVKSSCFYIVSNGKIERGKFNYAARCVFDRKNKKILYWHEG